jgi:mannitol/fructose-specific phosphotransferase system IIA component (Ntr-type)
MNSLMVTSELVRWSGFGIQETRMKLSDIILVDAIIPQLQATERNDAIAEAVAALAACGVIPKSRITETVDAVIEREDQATTGIGKGVALPHAKLKCVKHPVATIVRSSEGIDFSALDSKPVYSMILLLSSPDRPDEHLQAMETIFKHIQREIFRKFLRQAETTEAIVDLIGEADQIA